jgi:UDP-N-acetylglucosamine--N-acetylmuramyl-(pentapeptide) pyrophosphoryl-undecaprenol N-acetylglucosamine transferase
MKILFVVCGEGLGHASRSLHLGHYLQQQGHEVHYAGYGKSYDFMKQHGCINLHFTPREVILVGVNGFFSLKKTLWHARWIPFTLLESAASVRRLIRDYRFDCVVCDTMYGGVIAGWFRRVPVIFVTNQNHFNGFGGKTNLVWKTLNFLVQWYLNFAAHVIIPDYPAPDTVSEFNISIPEHKKGRYTFTGPFFEFDPARYTYENVTIFTSFGGEPYKLPMYAMLKAIADRRKDLYFDVFYTGPELPESSENFVSHGYVPNIYEFLARAKIAIVHGGLTTLHEALLFEKPVLMIMDPNHPEQQNNAKKVVEMGAGLSVDGRTVTGDVLEHMLAETMALAPRSFRAAHEAINGRKNAMDIITATVKSRNKKV